MLGYRIYGGPCGAGLCPTGSLGRRFATLARSTTFFRVATAVVVPSLSEDQGDDLSPFRIRAPPITSQRDIVKT